MYCGIYGRVDYNVTLFYVMVFLKEERGGGNRNSFVRGEGTLFFSINWNYGDRG